MLERVFAQIVLAFVAAVKADVYLLVWGGQLDHHVTLMHSILV